MRTQGVPQLLVVGALLSVGLLLTVPPVQAQSNGEGTIYSRFGLGTLDDFSSSQSEALGGGGFALRSLNYNSDANPALWSDQVLTRLTGGASVQSINTTDDAENSRQLTSGKFQAFQFNFPLYERKLGFGLSFQPYSRSNYDVTRTELDPEDTEFAHRVNFSGSGGLQRLRGGLGYRINEILSVGATADLLFGVIESRRRTVWLENTQALRNVLVSDGVQLSGFTSTLGSHLALADVFAEDDAFSIGASVTLPASLSGERFRTLDEDLARDTLSSREGDVNLPWKARLGVSYQPNAKWTFVADGTFEPWSNFSSDFRGRSADTAPVRFPIGGTSTLTDRWRISTGAEVVPAGEDQLAGYFSQVAYRLGGYVEHLYVRPDEQTDLHEFAVTAGFSLPTSASGTRIDLNARAGTRGTTSNSLVRDTFFGFSLHINFGERWFKRRKLR
jgi:hypothetical protein